MYSIIGMNEILLLSIKYDHQIVCLCVLPQTIKKSSNSYSSWYHNPDPPLHGGDLPITWPESSHCCGVFALKR